MLPVAQRDAQLAPAIPPVEPSPIFAARVASGIFAGLSLIIFVVAVLPHQGPMSIPRLVIAGACAVFAVALHLTADRIGLLGLQVAATCGTLLVSLHLFLSVEASSLSDEMLYGWLALYAAYFFTIRQAAAQLALMSGAYLIVLLLASPNTMVAGTAHARRRHLPRGRAAARRA